MTFVAAHALTCGVVAMPENCLESIIRLQRPAVRRQGVANGTRTDLALRRVTSVASSVRVDARLYRLSWARWRMAGRTSLSRFTFTLVVRRVVKLHVKALDKLCRKDFHRRLV